MSENKRTAQRYDRRIPIDYRTGDEWQVGRTRNLSLGGLYVETDGPAPGFGARVQLRFSIPTQREPVEVGGQVRWRDEGGFGVQFDGLRARDVWALGKYFEQPE